MNNLGQAIELAKLGRKTEAKEMLEKIVQAEPKNVPAWIWYADTWSTHEQKMAVLEACARVNSDNEQIRHAIEQLGKRQQSASNYAAPNSSPEPQSSSTKASKPQTKFPATETIGPGQEEPLIPSAIKSYRVWPSKFDGESGDNLQAKSISPPDQQSKTSSELPVNIQSKAGSRLVRKTVTSRRAQPLDHTKDSKSQFTKANSVVKNQWLMRFRNPFVVGGIVIAILLVISAMLVPVLSAGRIFSVEEYTVNVRVQYLLWALGGTVGTFVVLGIMGIRPKAAIFYVFDFLKTIFSSKEIPAPEPQPLVAHSLDERRAILQEVIIHYTEKGWRVVSQTDTTAQLIHPKEFSCLLAGCSLLLFGIGFLFYIFAYLAERDLSAYIVVDKYGRVITR